MDVMNELDAQHQVFVDKYFELNFHQTKAAIAAGFSKKTARQQASRLLTRVDIKAEVERRLTEHAMSANEVLARLAQHARGDMRDFINKSPTMLARHPEGNLIKKIKHTIVTSMDKEGKPEKEEKIELELYDAQAALIQIGRKHGLFMDKTDITSGGEKLGLTVEGVMDGSDSDALSEQIS
jgi:phage terminase small subunit